MAAILSKNSICCSWKVYSSVASCLYVHCPSCITLCMTSLGFSMSGDLELLLEVDDLRSSIGWTIVLDYLILVVVVVKLFAIRNCIGLSVVLDCFVIFVKFLHSGVCF